MKAINYFSMLIFFSLILIRCDKNDINPTLDEFCSVAPNGWECEIIQDNFSSEDIPQNANQPVAIIKFINREKHFAYFVGNKQVNPSLKLDFYPIAKRNELLNFIKSQQIFSWCIPMYYGETKEYFIITSPCFINGGSFTDEANSCINDLHAAIKKIISVNDYDFIGQ
jgi:hypothetical protein